MIRLRSFSILGIALCACSGGGTDPTTQAPAAENPIGGSAEYPAPSGDAPASAAADPGVPAGAAADAQDGSTTPAVDQTADTTEPAIDEAGASDQASGFESLDVPALPDDALATTEDSQAMLRLLITDAPVEAESVLVTFCDIQVKVDVESDEVIEAGHDADDAAPADTAPDADAEPADAEPADAEPADAEPADAEPAESEEGADGEPDADGEPAEDSAGWLTVSNTCQTYDLLTLQNGLTTDFGLADLPPGRYGQIRLGLTEASILVDGVWHELVVPSGAESGLKLGHHFELSAGSLTTLALDFDAGRSVHYAEGSGYMLRPVIEVVGERHESFDAARGHRPDAEEIDGEAGAGDAPHGNNDAPHGNSDAPHGNSDAPHGNGDAPRGNEHAGDDGDAEPEGAPADDDAEPEAAPAGDAEPETVPAEGDAELEDAPADDDAPGRSAEHGRPERDGK